MQYKLVYAPTKQHSEECGRVLKEGVKYRLLNFEEATRKAKIIGGVQYVHFGYSDSLYNSRKGNKPFVYLVHNYRGWGLKHNPIEFNVSIDMVEPYQKIIKYNRN